MTPDFTQKSIIKYEFFIVYFLNTMLLWFQLWKFHGMNTRPVQKSFRIYKNILVLSGFKFLDYIPYRSGNPVANQMGVGYFPGLFSQCRACGDHPKCHQGCQPQSATSKSSSTPAKTLQMSLIFE